MKENFLTYLKGLVLCYFATLAFASVEWISVNQNLAYNRLVVPLIIGSVIWTILFFSYKAIWSLIFILAAFMDIVGVIIGLGCLGYGSLRLGQYVMGPDVVKITNDDFWLVVMGLVYAIITFIAEPRPVIDKNVQKLKKALK